MAYLFSKLNEAIDQSGGRRASDVLQGGPAQQDRETLAAQPSQGIASQPSAVIGAGAPQAQPNAAGEAPTAVNSESRSKMFEKNKGTELRSDAAETVKAGIAGATAKLQDEANKYVQGAQYQAFDQGTATKAVDTGDADAVRKTSAFLSGAPETKPAFQGADLSGVETQVGALQSNEGLDGLLRQQRAAQSGGEGYTAGEARLDASFLKRSDAFKQQRLDAAKQFEQAQAANRKAVDDTRAADVAASSARERDREALKSLLAQRRDSAVSADAEAGRRETAARQALNDRAAQVRQELMDSYMKRPEFANQANMAGVANRDLLRKAFENPALERYLTAGGGVGNYVSADTASRFNRINQLLGLGETLQASGSLDGRGSFDEAGYRKAVEDAIRGLKLNAIPSAPPSEARPVPIAGRTFDQIGAVIDGVKSAGRAADPTSATSRTNPVSGTANTVAKGAALAAKAAPAPAKKPAQAVAKVADKGAKAAQTVASKADPRKWGKK